MSAVESHEPSDARPRGVLITAGSIVLTILIVLAISRFLIAARSRREPAAAPPADGSFRDGGSARTGIELDWERIAADRRLHFSGYGWIDRRAGIVRLPIERAMELVAERDGSGSATSGGGRPNSAAAPWVPGTFRPAPRPPPAASETQNAPNAPAVQNPPSAENSPEPESSARGEFRGSGAKPPAAAGPGRFDPRPPESVMNFLHS